jgi:hypothetical protein
MNCRHASRVMREVLNETREEPVLKEQAVLSATRCPDIGSPGYGES